MSMNLGALLGIIVYGYIVYSLGWSYAFLLSAIGLLLSFIFVYKNFNELQVSFEKNISYFFCFLILSIVLGVLLCRNLYFQYRLFCSNDFTRSLFYLFDYSI